MKNSKQFYKDLPRVNGFKWAFHDTGLHCFTKGSNIDGFISCYLTESDIDKMEVYQMMLNRGISRNIIVL